MKFGDILSENAEIVRLPNGKLAHFVDKDAYSFIYSKKDDLFLYGQTKGSEVDVYHKHLLETLVHALHDRKSIDNSKKTISYATPPYNQIRTVHYKGSLPNLLSYAVKYKNNPKYKHGALGMYRVDPDLGVMGRYWASKNVIAIWEEPKNVVELINNGSMEKIIRLCDMNPETTWIDVQNHVYPYKDLLDNMNKAKTMSREEWKELMIKQHLDPVAKKKVAGDYAAMQRQKAMRGFDTVAQMNNARPALEGIIKLKDLLS